MIDASVSSDGSRVIDIKLRRHQKGVKVSVKVAPEVEDFFKRWGGGVSESPTSGRMWRPLHDGDAKINCWSLETPIEADGYNLRQTGNHLNVSDGVNLSFLRIVGASEGREFIVETVMSRSEMERIADRLRRSAASFYQEYLQPVHLGVFVSVRDLTRAE